MSNINKFDAGAKPSSDSVRADYFNWLCDMIMVDAEDGESYSILCSCLYSIPFYSNVMMDENREKDSEELHALYCFANPALSESWVMDCLEENGHTSVFEVMISLAMRMVEFAKPPIISDEIEYPYTVAKFFWEMINNLGLEDLDDENFYFRDGGQRVDEVIENLLERRYSRKGKGGLFPVERGSKDQRYMELWEQMHQYLNEKYPIL